MQKIRDHFKKVDPILYRALEKIEKLEPLNPREQKDFFYALCYNIIGQQLSGKAAQTIFERFLKLFSEGEVTSKKVLKLTEQELRAVGMSYSKARFLKDLAKRVEQRELALEKLTEMSNEEIIEELMKVKGIGRWTAEMFLMFSLGREDVFSHGDLGLKNAIKKLYKIDNPTMEQVEEIVAKWSPFKTYASRILWKSLDSG